MKRVILIIGLLLPCCFCMGQAQLFKSAMSIKRPGGHYYTWTNSQEKVVSEEDIKKYAEKNDIMLGKITKKDIARFGYAANTVYSFDFIPRSEYPLFLMENIVGGIPISYFANTGHMYVYRDEGSPIPSMHKVTDIMWSGGVKDGAIDGEGVGVKQVDKLNYIAVKGSFSAGVPQGKVEYINYTSPRQFGEYSRRYAKSSESEFGRESEGMTSFRWKNQYGYLDQFGEIAISPRYSAASEFFSGKAKVVYKDVPILIDKSAKPVEIDNALEMPFDQMVSLSKNPEFASAVEPTIRRNMPYYSLEDLLEVDKYFPVFKDVTSEYKIKLYNQDSKVIGDIFDRTLEEDKKDEFFVSNKDRSKVNSFVSSYFPAQFDPDSVLYKALYLQQYYTVGDALLMDTESGSYLDETADPPVFTGVKELKIMDDSMQLLSDESFPFRKFATSATRNLEKKKQQIQRSMSEEYNKYCERLAKSDEEQPQDLDEITCYEYESNTMREYPHEYYRLGYSEENGITLSWAKSNSNITVLHVSKEAMEKVAAMINEYKLTKLKNSYVPPVMIHDGIQWSISIRSGKKHVSSHGSNAWPPDKQKDGINEIHAYLDSLIEAATEEDVIEVKNNRL